MIISPQTYPLTEVVFDLNKLESRTSVEEGVAQTSHDSSTSQRLNVRSAQRSEFMVVYRAVEKLISQYQQYKRMVDRDNPRLTITIVF